jgi:amino acid adenylation domain-containing protein
VTTPTGAAAVHDVALPALLSGALPGLADRLGVPLRTVLLAVHVAVVGLLAGSADVRTGCDHREAPDGDATGPGPRVRTLPLRVHLGAGGTWTDLIAAVHRAEAAMVRYAGVPMAGGEGAAGPDADPFETGFGFDSPFRSGAPFRAGFSRADPAGEIRLRVHYDARTNHPAQIARWGGYYRRALEQVVAGPTAARRPAGLIGADERRQLRGFSGPDVALPDATFPDLFNRQVREHPDRLALACGRVQLSYAELDAGSERITGYLRDAGIARGDVVTTLLPRGIPWAVTVLALLRMGAVYLPQDPDHPAERIASVLRRSGCHHVITGRDTAGGPLAEIRGRQPDLDILRYEEAPATPPAGSPATRPAPRDPAYIIFTSGSTGEPKGAVIAHSGMLNHLLAKHRDLRLERRDRIAQTATQCFDISVWQLLAAWMCGASTRIYTRYDVLDVPGFLRALGTDRVTVLEVVPSYLDLLLTEADRRPVDLPDLRLNVVTGERLPPALTRRWFARYPVVPLINAYGPTEASDDVTHHYLDRPVDGARVPVGRPIMNTGIHVVGQDNSPRPLGSFGEICVTGAGVGLGYINDAERTAAAFQPNTLDRRSDTLYRTGDIGRWLPGGLLDCAGRYDDQVKVRGHRIELSDVDGALVRLPGVDTAVTVAQDLDGQLRLVVYFAGPAAADLVEFQRGLSGMLPDYMRPEKVVRLAQFPLTVTGKVDRKALARRELPARQPPTGG